MSKDVAPRYKAVISRESGDRFYTVELRRVGGSGIEVFVRREVTLTRRGARHWARKTHSRLVRTPSKAYREEVELTPRLDVNGGSPSE